MIPITLLVSTLILAVQAMKIGKRRSRPSASNKMSNDQRKMSNLVQKRYSINKNEYHHDKKHFENNNLTMQYACTNVGWFSSPTNNIKSEENSLSALLIFFDRLKRPWGHCFGGYVRVGVSNVISFISTEEWTRKNSILKIYEWIGKL